MNSNIASPVSVLFLFVLLVFSLQSCMSPRERSIKRWEKTQWSIVKEDKKDAPDWIIYTREIPETDFLEYKIEGEVEASPNSCISMFKSNIHDLSNGSKNDEYPTYNSVYESEDSLLTYVVHKEPFPFKDAEMSVRYVFYQDSESNAEIVEWKEAWEVASIPSPSKKLSRVETFRGFWRFSLIQDNFSKAVNSVQFNPKKMPLWLIEPMVTKFLIEELEVFKGMNSEEE